MTRTTTKALKVRSAGRSVPTRDPDGGAPRVRPDADPRTAGDDVPFISARATTAEPFADLGSSPPVDEPGRMLAGWRAISKASVGVEAAVGRYRTVPAALLTKLAHSARAVARITTRGTNWRAESPVDPWRGTGFLVGKNLLLTNHHVLNSPDVARIAVVEFDYEVSAADLASGALVPAASPRVFKLDPGRLFVTSPVQGGLDYTFVWIEDQANALYPSLELERASFTALRGEQAFVIHHPRGELKQASLDDTDVLGIDSTVIHYASDTEYGSSGAPVLDLRGRLMALHHARSPVGYDLPGGGHTDVVNEGIKIGAIAIDLENRIKAGGADASFAERVLGSFKGSDSLTGYFSGLGRPVDGKSGVEAVVDVYRGSAKDIDIGFWNIEWLANRWHDRAKLVGAAKVIVDLNLDVWALSEISPPAIEALVAEIKATFGETYRFGLSEPDAPESRQTTAVLWKERAVKGEELEWPEKHASLLRLDSRDPEVARLEAVEGKVFDRYPGLFRFTAKGDGGFDFFLVPLHLKAMEEGSKRRRLASKILAHIIGSMIREGADADWIVGGDMNAELASRDFASLIDADFTPLSAADEREGGFSYIRSPKSLIDHIFVSPNVRERVDEGDYFIVAQERSVEDYVKNVSDHRPVLLRLSLSRRVGPAAGDEAELAAVAERITARNRPGPQGAPAAARR